MPGRGWADTVVIVYDGRDGGENSVHSHTLGDIVMDKVQTNHREYRGHRVFISSVKVPSCGCGHTP